MQQRLIDALGERRLRVTGLTRLVLPAITQAALKGTAREVLSMIGPLLVANLIPGLAKLKPGRRAG